MRRIVYAMFMAACVAVACEKDPSSSGSEGATPDFDKSSAVLVEVPAKDTGVELWGMGVELDPHFLSQNVTRKDGATKLDWTRIVCKRVTQMKVQRFRVMVLPHWWEPYNDDDDPDHFNDSAFTWDNQEMESLYAVLDLAESTGADVVLVLWGCPISARCLDANIGHIGRHFLANDGTNWVTGTGDDKEFAENFVALVKHLVEVKKYTCVKEITPYNEPNGNVADAVSYIKTARALDSKLKSEGLRDRIKLHLSDNTDNATSFLQVCATQLGDIADIFNSHTYIFGYSTTNSSVKDWESTNVGISNGAGKPHFVGEFGSNQCVGATRQTDINKYERGVLLARHVVNFLNAGAAGASYWSLLDQYYGKNESYGQMQQLGLWRYKTAAYQADDLAGVKTDYWCRPQYYSYSLLTRFIRKGSKVYPLRLEGNLVAGTAICSGDGKWTYIFANGGDKAVNYYISNSTAAGMEKCDVYRYVSGGLPGDDSMLAPVMKLAPVNGAFRVDVPKQSVLVLTQIDPDTL